MLVLAVFVTAVSMFITVSVYSSTSGRLGNFKKLAQKVVTRQSGATLLSFFTQFLVVTFLLSMSLAVADGFGRCGDDIPAALRDLSEEVDRKCKNPKGMDKYVILFETESSTPLLKSSKFDNHIYLQYDFDKEGLALICKEEKVSKDNINKKDICKGNYQGIYILAEMNRLVDALYNKERCDTFFAMEAFPNLNENGKVDGDDLINLAMAEKRRIAIEQELHKIINEEFSGKSWRPWPRVYLSTAKNDKDKYPVWHNKFFEGQGKESNKDFVFVLKNEERPSKKMHVAVLLTPISMAPATNRIGYEHVPKKTPENNTSAVNDTPEEPNEIAGKIKRQKKFIDYLYFMIYTITTTGYGDLHPKGDFARLLVSIANLIEVFFGVIFINVLIAHGMLRYHGQFQQEDKRMLPKIKEDTSKLANEGVRSDNEANRNRKIGAQATVQPNPNRAYP
uniref:Ion channel n=1 Tax=Candidatus Kentrum sp. LPFa TaxID=2126335 RepID=A0A450VZY3_9GAMM|nr:MAG: Ion channel [Candidatus Kentron sp. LPFa]